MTTIDVDQVLEGAKLRGPALVALICAASSLILDGFDIQAVGFAAPALVGDLSVERAALGPALAASLVGMAFGAAGIGSLGDRWGRRRALLLSTALFGAATLLAATATSVAALAAWRFATGIGLGGALPTATALIAEFSPRKVRPQTIGAIQVGVPIGGLLGAMLAAELIPTYGWRSVFVAGGVLPLLAALAMYCVLPESPRFLATRPQAAPQLAALLSKIDPAGRYSAIDTFVLGSEDLSTAQSGVRALFSPQLRWDTIVVSLAFLTNVYAVYAFFNWAPLVLTSLGFDLVTAVRGALVFNLTGIVGVLAVSWLIARLGSRRPLAVSALAAAAALAWLAFADELPALMGGIAVAGAAICAVQVGLYTLSAHVFPTECRTSGIGLALGAGRVGGIASSLGGGVLLTLTGAAGFFGCIAAVLALTFATVLVVRRQIPALTPEDSRAPPTSRSAARGSSSRF
jgi:MFS transporter, AAHS family, 4-hydroxybenzoate transporter